MTLLHQAAQKAVEALEIARTGLQWYRGMMPEYVDGSDGEADEEIQAALNALESALQQPSEPVAWLVTGGRAYNDRAYIAKDSAELEAVDRGDGSKAVPLYTAPALQHQEVPREPVARPSMSMYASAADYSAAMDGWIATTRQCPACKGKFGVDGQACDLCNATGRVPSTTRQQEDGNV